MVNSQVQVQLDAQKDIRWVSLSVAELFDRELRLDASSYTTKDKNARKIVENCKFEKTPLNDENGFAIVSYPGRFKRIFVDDGIPIFTSSQILELSPESNKSISDKTNADLQPLYLVEGQIVMTRSGSIGYCSLVSKTLSGLLFSDDLLRIQCNNKADTGYLYAFLKTEIGKTLVTTNNYGSVVTHLEPEHLNLLAVPNPPSKIKQPISDKIFKSFSLRDEANNLVSRAQENISTSLKIPPLKELKLKYFDEMDVRNFEIKSSELDLRFEATYHAPLIDEINKQLKESGVELATIGDKRITKSFSLPGRFKRVFVEEGEGVPYFSGAEIKKFDYSLKYLSRTANPKSKMSELTLRENEILITCSGTLGDHLLVPNFMNGWVGSHDIIRLIPNQQFNIGYISAWLGHPYGKELLLRQAYGSVVTHIDDKQVATVSIPLLNSEKMNAIGNLVLKANDLRSEAWLLEKEAVQDVENLIINNQK